MKNKFLLVIGGLFFLLLIFSFFKLTFQKQAPSQLIVGENEILFPQGLLEKYEIVQAKELSFVGSEDKFVVFGFKPVNINPTQLEEKSFLKIYKKTNNSLEQVYEFLPLLPENLYPMPLVIENIWPINSWEQDGLKASALVTSWGETGADYFGTHPIVFAYQDSYFNVVSFYKGCLGNQPEIKKSSWNQPDFEVKNYFGQNNVVKTILTQEVAVEDSQIVLTFYADNNCKACKHNYYKLKIPWK